MTKLTKDTTLSQWLDWIDQNHTRDIKFGLERIRFYAHQLKIFKKKLAKKIVMIAGTNGKGTCLHTLESILLNSGLRVGSYVSPHLYEFNERIRMNGQNISDNDLCKLFLRVYQTLDSPEVTFFEYVTLAAFVYFSTQEIDVLLLEIGMGGNLDAVNIIKPDISVITSIDLDHTDRLGSTLEEISVAKAGVLHKDTIAVLGFSDNYVAINEAIKKHNLERFIFGNDFNLMLSDDNNSWEFKTKDNKINNLKYCLQNKTAIAAGLMSCIILQRFFSLKVQNFQHGLEKLNIPGRLQLLQSPVPTIMDVAHNPAASKWLVSSIDVVPATGSTYAVFGCLEDKDVANIILPFKKVVTKWFLSALPVFRGLDEKQLAKIFQEHNFSNVSCFVNPLTAYQEALSLATTNDRIVVFGSFHTVSLLGEIIKRDNQ